jgi:hypothetical protein
MTLEDGMSDDPDRCLLCGNLHPPHELTLCDVLLWEAEQVVKHQDEPECP